LIDSSKHTYFKELKKVVETADVILEVLDARDPQGCRCVALEQKILASSSQKRILLVLNKIGK
jgi:nuclear GTP-binding protein